MGMSASQTRYVFVTGKKTDIEYEGQQINQQRTTLATKTAALNTQLLNMKVPTPPSVDQFTKTTYSYEANGTTFKVTAAQLQPNGTYNVFLSNDTVTSMGKSSGSSLFSSTGAGSYQTSQGTTLTALNLTPGTPGYDPAQAAIDSQNTALIMRDANLPAGTTFFKYTAGNITKYVTAADLAADANSTRAIPTFYVDENAKTTVNSQLVGAQVAWNESGRMTSITTAAPANQTFMLSTTTTSDNAAYTDAMNEYEYQKGVYEKVMNDINAQMSIIQSEDKKLELKLKDLDTQQEAINTELDSLKKVVDKDIEQSFKAFG